jgi:hypothetical protein
MGALNRGMPVTGAKPGSALIRFTCDRPDHAKRTQRFTLTILNGQWAFCSHEGPTTDHSWRPIAAVKLDQLLERRHPK